MYAKYPYPKRPIPPYHEGGLGHDDEQHQVVDDPTPHVPISWGGTMIDDPTDEGLLHAFVAVCCYNPESIMHDSNGCQIVHTTTRDLSTEGFAFQGVALETERTCPHIALHDGTYYMYNTGNGQECNVTCTGADYHRSSPSDRDRVGGVPCGGTGFNGIGVATSASLDGPWTNHDNIQVMNLSYGQGNINPSPLFRADGSVLVAATMQGRAIDEQVFLAEAAAGALTTGPYVKLGPPNSALFAHPAEDPFLWRSAKRGGSYHVLAHDMDRRRFQGNSSDANGQVGLHAFSPDGAWDTWKTPPRIDGPLLEGDEGAAACVAACVAAGHCCQGDVSSYRQPSCEMGCTIAAGTASQAACNATCASISQAKECSYTFGSHVFQMCESCPDGCASPSPGWECEEGCGYAHGVAPGAGAYSTTVQFDDGTAFDFFRRERPELRFDAEGNPTHLLTGIEYPADHSGRPNNHQYSFTIVQEINQTTTWAAKEQPEAAAKEEEGEKSTATTATAKKKKQPHILLILSDDLGYNDVGWHGSEIATPFLDSLVAKGVELSNYYGHMICTPSRSALMSGRYAFHAGMQHSYWYPGQSGGLPLKFPTLADHLKAEGYSTHMVGKCESCIANTLPPLFVCHHFADALLHPPSSSPGHLGYESRAYTPLGRGFDSYYGYLGGGEDYYTHESGGYVDLHAGADLAPVRNETGSYSAGLFANKTIDIIDAHAGDAPLFLYLAFQSVHAPIEAPAPSVAPYAWITDKDRRTMAGMVSTMDSEIARVSAALERNGYLDDCLIVFLADNGGPPYIANSNFPMRGGKWTIWEGGTHLVGFASGFGLPAKTETALMHHVDWVPTLVAAAGGALRDAATPPVDGVDLWPTLTAPLEVGVAAGTRTEVVMNVDQTNQVNVNDAGGWSGYAAIRVGGLKLALGWPGIPDGWCLPNQNATAAAAEAAGAAPAPALPYPGPPSCGYRGKVPPTAALRVQPHLYNLTSDPGERHDLAASAPDAVAALRARLQVYIDSAVPPLNEFTCKAKPGVEGCRGSDPGAIAARDKANAWVVWK